jgi:hypothetical protein
MATLKNIWDAFNSLDASKLNPKPTTKVNKTTYNTNGMPTITRPGMSLAPTPTTGTPKPVYSESDYIKQALAGIVKPVGSSGIGGISSAYDQEAAANKAAIENSANITRNDLTTRIQRLREDINATKSENANTFNTTRSDLESNAFMTTRANRASAASRGLSGSGLEQLAQLQTMLKTNKNISDVAGAYTGQQGKLRTELQRGEETYNTDVNNLNTNTQTALQQVLANLASKKASAAASAAASDAANMNNYNQNVANATANAKSIYAGAKATSTTILDAFKGTKKTAKDVKAAKTKAQEAYASGLLGDTPDLYNALIAKLKKK